MTLDPQAQAFLQAAAGSPPVHQLSVPEARLSGLGYLALQRPARAVADVEHRFIPGPTADLPIRIYRPTRTTGGPVVVMFHGSGWVICNIDCCDEPARALALDTGATVITVNYQKAPEHPFPVPLDDCYATVEWVRDNADALGVDATRLAVVGDSAGGNLAAAVALRARDRNGPAIAAQALLYPALTAATNLPSYAEHDADGAVSTADMRWFWRHYLAGDEARGRDPYAAPLLADDLAGLPPAFVAAAEYDVLRDEAAAYAARLADAGVATTFVEYGGMIHGFYWMDAVLDASLDLQRDLAAWLLGRLGGAAVVDADPDVRQAAGVGTHR